MTGAPLPADLSILLMYDLHPDWPDRDKEEVSALIGQLSGSLASVGYRITPLQVNGNTITPVLAPFAPDSHLVFNWCESLPGISHGEPLVVRELEELNFVFTGAGSAALEFTQNKQSVKAMLDRSGIPTPAWRVYERPLSDGWDLFPAIVKPVNEHCSEGITPDSVVMTETELASRIEFILETYQQPALVEDFIDGREFHVSLWGNGHIEMLPPAEMDFSRFSEVRDRLCTYDAKFIPGSLHYESIQTLLPAPLEKGEMQSLESICRKAYALGGCRDYGRIDVRMRDGIFYVLDINPNADISADASFACAAEYSGFSYGAAMDRIIRFAAKRFTSSIQG